MLIKDNVGEHALYARAVALDLEGNGFGIFESKGEEEERAPIRSTTTETKVEDSKAISEV